MSPLIRICSCLLLFGLGAQALAGGTLGVLGSAIIAFAANRAWRRQEQDERRRQHERDVVADEQLRLDVRHRREREGRLP